MEPQLLNTTVDLDETLKLLEEQETYYKFNKFKFMFPDEGKYRRELYPKHVKFMNAGRDFMQRAFVAANRVGKSQCGAYEMVCHLTGDYPHWWKGKRFLNPIDAWTAGKTAEAVKDIQQKILLGAPGEWGTGLIPKDKLVEGGIIRKAGSTADAVLSVSVKHKSGGVSTLTFKAYDQKRDAFQGTYKHVIWLDEEPRDPGIYSECLTRLIDDVSPGIIYCTFTPLFGRSDIVNEFLPGGLLPPNNINGYKYVEQVSWDEVPHLPAKEKEILLASYSRHEREARSRGIPSLGAGAIYPYLDEDITCDPVEIMPWWPRAYGLDVGWQSTAAIWVTKNPDTGMFYVYSEYYSKEPNVAVHADAIKARGNWIEGAIDPNANGLRGNDGRTILDMYEDAGARVNPANNAVEAGIFKISQMFEAGVLKIFNSCLKLKQDRRDYHRDENGRIVKGKGANDCTHTLDAFRYVIMEFDNICKTLPYNDGNSQNYIGRPLSRK